MGPLELNYNLGPAAATTRLRRAGKPHTKSKAASPADKPIGVEVGLGWDWEEERR